LDGITSDNEEEKDESFLDYQRHLMSFVELHRGEEEKNIFLDFVFSLSMFDNICLRFLCFSS